MNAKHNESRVPGKNFIDYSKHDVSNDDELGNNQASITCLLTCKQVHE